MAHLTDRRRGAGALLPLLAIVLCALSLRAALTSASSIVTLVSEDILITPAVLGFIGMLPLLTFAAGGVVTPWIARRVGLEGGFLVACALMALGHLGRGLAPDLAWFILATIAVLTGMGIGNVLLPPAVKRYFPHRIGIMTTLYASLFAVGTSVPAALAAPIADASGWRISLATWAVLALVAAPPWLLLLARNRGRLVDAGIDQSTSPPYRFRQLLRSRTVWGLTLVHAISSMNGYSMITWMPDLLIETAGIGAVEAGALLSLFTFTAFPLTLIVPTLAVRMRNPGVLAYVGGGAFIAGFASLMLWPSFVTAVWVVIAASGTVMFVITLVLVGTRTKTHALASTLSGFTQGFGYLIGAAGPLVVGLLRQVSGGWTLPLAFLILTSCVVIVGGVLLSKPRFVEDELASRSDR